MFLPTRDPNFPQLTHKTTQLSKQYGVDDNIPDNLTVLLRRVACPYIPEKATPEVIGSTVVYNPFVTTDYVQQVKNRDNRKFNKDGEIPTPPDPKDNRTQRRNQPYSAAFLYDTALENESPNSPQHSFFRHNSREATGATADAKEFRAPFLWLAHLDRPVVNALELIHVSTCRPHELTQRFVTYDPTGTPQATQQHALGWGVEKTLLYRALDHLDAASRLNGAIPGARVPGKVNINTIFDRRTFEALADASNTFTAAEVQAIYENMVKSRDGVANAGDVPTASALPYRSFSQGYVDPTLGSTQFPAGAGLRDTLLRNNNQFKVNSGTHSYKEMELLQKIYNNVTTTSNVFAVWLTVGYFEVEDTAVIGGVETPIWPPKLVKEVGREDGRHVRHRMFAIIDRSELRAFPDRLANYNQADKKLRFATPHPGITLQAGDTLFFELWDPTSNTLADVFPVTWNAGNQWEFDVDRPLPTQDYRVVCRGNPGPQPRFNARSDPRLVPHFTIIE